MARSARRRAAILLVTLGPGLAVASGANPAAAPTADPRIALVELQLAGHTKEALVQVDEALAREPETARRHGYTYLRGDLLLRLGRLGDALAAFASTLAATPGLAAHARLRLALEQDRLGHPEVAAGLLATLLAKGPPRELVGPTVRGLRRALAAGGDCRLLGTLPAVDLPTAERRELELAVAACALRLGEVAAGRRGLIRILEEDATDEPARLAVEALLAREPTPADAATSLRAGIVLHHHREFPRAIELLARGLALPDAPTLPSAQIWEARYALARCQFWLERYGVATPAFGAIAADAAGSEAKARALYQQARSYELADDWPRAVTAFQAAARAAPSGSWADAATSAVVRLQWRQGDEAGALATLAGLLRERRAEAASRSLLFLAASDLVQGRAERASAWLTRVAELGQATRPELAYWQGRERELAGNPAAAVERYLAAVRDDSHHPFARAARARLAGPRLATAADQAAARLAVSRQAVDLHVATLVLEPADPRAKRAGQRLAALLRADPATAPFVAVAVRPVASWRLWTARLDEAAERLLALGLFDEGAAAISRHFPATDPALAYTGSRALAAAGEHRRSLLLVEILAKRAPSRLPQALLAGELRQLLYPFPYRKPIQDEARRRGIDPYLLAGLIREESRFDPRAFSGASARGLTQFVLPTARRVAASSGLDGGFHPDRLDDPEVSITLGAAYLAELGTHFDGAVEQVVAAYNAGEPQAALWRRYCYSDEPEEYLTKVAFKETRHYIRRVLSSRNHYLELYGGLGVAAPGEPGNGTRRR